MGKIENLITILLLLVLSIVVLLLLNLIYITGFEFSLESYDHLVSPTAAVIAFIFYYRALVTSQQQNDLLMSQNLKNNFEQRIDAINLKYRNEIFLEALGNYPQLIGLKFSNKIVDVIINDLFKNNEYTNDVIEFNKNKLLPIVNLKAKSYYGFMLYIFRFISELSNYKFFLINVFGLLDEIENSRMSIEDKKHLIVRIIDELLFDFVYLYTFENAIHMEPYLPQFDTVKAPLFTRFTDTILNRHLKKYEYYTNKYKIN